MITDTMTSEELGKELISDDAWVKERMIGLKKKYHKQLKNRMVREGTFLGSSSYTTPLGNSVFVCLFKTYADYKEKFADISFATLYSYWHRDKRRYLYTMCYPGTQTYSHSIIFSAHSVERMKERLGMDITEVFVQHLKTFYGCTSFTPNDYNGKEDESYCDFGPCILLARDHPWGKIVSTVITKGQQHTNQQLMALASSRDANRLNLMTARITWQVFEDNKPIYKRSLIKQAG